jgi:outer membrane protein OmpA-like peptidoglycan-associated protein
MKNKNQQSQVRLEAKRHTELWIYSLADMYMILTVFFIAIAAIYAARARNVSVSLTPPTAGRGPAAVTSLVSVEFETGSDQLSEKAIQDLQVLLPALRGSKGTIDIEGYADGKSLQTSKSKFSSNLDLSSSRAVRVAEWLIDKGVSARRVRVSSFGNSKLFKTGANGISTNRRVLLKLLPLEDG